MKNRMVIVCFAHWFTLCFFIHQNVKAQSPWDGIKKGTQAPKKKVDDLSKKVIRFKSHLEKWGLDSNFNHGIAIGARLNSNGWTGLVSYQKRINRRQLAIYQLSFSEIKHEKEIKQQRQNTAYPELGNSAPFIFGKINNAYSLQLGYGREYLLLPGVLEGNISVGLRMQGGFSLAMLKPYYLRLLYVTDTPNQKAWVQEERFNETNTDKFLNTGYILGKSKWKKGISEINYIPGIYLDGALTIEANKNKTFIKTVSLGCNFSFQTGRGEIMVDQKSYNWFACLYAGLNIGKLWK